MAHDVFISYASKDKVVADALCATLEGQKIRCWIAPRDILAGIQYGEALIEALNASRIMVLVFSSSSNNSPQVLREMERAASKGIPIIPFRIEDVPLSKAMEYFISSPHWLDALTPPLEKHIRNLAETVKILLSRTPTTAPVGQPGTSAAAVGTGEEPRASAGETLRTSRGGSHGRFVQLKFLGYAALLIGICVAAYFVLSPNRNQPKQESTGADRTSQGTTQHIAPAVSHVVETPVLPTNQGISLPASINTQAPPPLVVSTSTQPIQDAAKTSPPVSLDPRRQTKLRWSLGSGFPISAAAFSPHGRRVAAGWVEAVGLGHISVFDPNTGAEGGERSADHRTYEYDRAKPPRVLAFSLPSGSMLAAGGFGQLTNISVFDDLAHSPRVLQGHSEEVTSVAFSPNGETLASGSRDTTIKLWNGQTGTLLNTLTGHASVVSGLAFSTDGKTLASASHDKTIGLWDVESRELVRTLTGHSHWVESASFSDDGKTLASGSSDTTVRVWNVETGKQVWSLTGHDEEITCVVLAPNSNVIASGSNDKTIRLWNARTGQVITTLVGHTGDVIALAFTANSELVSLSKDKTTILWDVRAAIEKNR